MQRNTAAIDFWTRATATANVQQIERIALEDAMIYRFATGP